MRVLIIEDNPDIAANVRERLLRLERSVTEMSDAVSGLLLLSRAPESTPVAATSRYAVAQVLQEAIEQHRYLLSDKPVELVVEASAQPHVTPPCTLCSAIWRAMPSTTRPWPHHAPPDTRWHRNRE